MGWKLRVMAACHDPAPRKQRQGASRAWGEGLAPRLPNSYGPAKHHHPGKFKGEYLQLASFEGLSSSPSLPPPDPRSSWKESKVERTSPGLPAQNASQPHADYRGRWCVLGRFLPWSRDGRVCGLQGRSACPSGLPDGPQSMLVSLSFIDDILVKLLWLG